MTNLLLGASVLDTGCGTAATHAERTRRPVHRRFSKAPGPTRDRELYQNHILILRLCYSKPNSGGGGCGGGSGCGGGGGCGGG